MECKESEDGQIVLGDDCENMAYVDMKRFKAVFDKGKQE